MGTASRLSSGRLPTTRPTPLPHAITALLAAVIALVLSLSLAPDLEAAEWLLVDFGATEGENQYGIESWENAFIGPHTAYTDAGPGGTTQISSDGGVYADYQGVSGTPLELAVGNQILVTWYNASEGTVSFIPIVSFTDPDLPGSGVEGQWYTMSSVWDLVPGESRISTYDVHDTTYAACTLTGASISAGTYEIVNVSRHDGGSYRNGEIVCDMIVLTDAADIAPPGSPQNLTANAESDTKIDLAWEAPVDGADEVAEYWIYRDVALVGVATGTTFTDCLLSPETSYTYTVTAVDAIDFASWIKHNESPSSNPAVAMTGTFQGGESLVNPPDDIEYLGAFRLPGPSGGSSWSYAGDGLTFHPSGDPDGPEDGFPGSLIGIGHAGEFFHVSEISIPEPVIISSPDDLDQLETATTLQPFTDIRAWDPGYQINEGDVAYLPPRGDGDPARLYYGWADGYTQDGKLAVVGRCDLAGFSNPLGPWYVGPADGEPGAYNAGSYLTTIPDAWAQANTPDQVLLVGEYRGGGWGDNGGPPLYAFQPATDGDPPLDPSGLPYTALLKYAAPYTMDGFHTDDEWKGVVWVSVGDRSAVILSGTKALGRYYYGYPEGTIYGRVWFDVPNPFEGTGLDKGNYASTRAGVLLFYDPEELAAVARGELSPHDPQPYAMSCTDPEMVKEFEGAERRRLWSVACDDDNGLLYAFGPRRVDGDRNLVHVWRIRNEVSSAEGAGSTGRTPPSLTLHPSRPNPFGPQSTISFDLGGTEGGRQPTRLDIYDLQGRRVRSLVSGALEPGRYTVTWDGRDTGGGQVSAGVYLCILAVGERTEVRKLILVR